jgi:CDGSH-type Zn-finger protein
MSEVTIQAFKNGPFIVKGAVKVLDHEGREFNAEGKAIALCRCGQSANRPFCDGTHNRCGFASEERA